MKKFQGEANQSLFIARDNIGKPVNPQEAIFPIFFESSDRRLRMVGTGFFIAPFGLFVTAKHVLQDILDAGYGSINCATIAHCVDDAVYWRKFKYYALHPVGDVAVGICEFARIAGKDLLTNKIVPINPSPPKIGDPVFTYAYPFMEIENGENSQNIAANPRYYAGKVLTYYPYPPGRDKYFLPGACYQTDITIHGGASGGPVFTGAAGIVGLNSSSFSGQLDISYISDINDIWQLDLHDDNGERKTVRDLLASIRPQSCS